MSNLRPVSFTSSPGDDFSDALLGPRFAWVLASWWDKQQWYISEDGYSIAELYFCFVQSSGWSAPQNIALFKEGSLPLQWKSKAKTAFVSAMDYPDLQFAKVAFSKQVATFLHCAKFLAKRFRWDLGFHRGISWV